MMEMLIKIIKVSSFQHHDSYMDNSLTVFCLTGSALDIHFNGVNVASINRELEDQEGSDLGLASKRFKS